MQAGYCNAGLDSSFFYSRPALDLLSQRALLREGQHDASPEECAESWDLLAQVRQATPVSAQMAQQEPASPRVCSEEQATSALPASGTDAAARLPAGRDPVLYAAAGHDPLEQDQKGSTSRAASFEAAGQAGQPSTPDKADSEPDPEDVLDMDFYAMLKDFVTMWGPSSREASQAARKKLLEKAGGHPCSWACMLLNCVLSAPPA